MANGNDRKEWEALVADTASRAAGECTVTDGRRIVSVMRSQECLGYDCCWAEVVGNPETRMYGINADEGILLDWDELADGELKAVEAMCPDAYSVALHLLNGDMGLEDDRWARPATDPVGYVCLLACEAPSLGEYCGIDPVEAAVAWLEDISEIDGVREQEASRFLQHLGELCEDDTFARVPAKECGAFLELGSYGHNFWLAVENSNGRANAETKDRRMDEARVLPEGSRRCAGQDLSALWEAALQPHLADLLGVSIEARRGLDSGVAERLADWGPRGNPPLSTCRGSLTAQAEREPMRDRASEGHMNRDDGR